MTNFAEQLTAARKAAGMTQEELSEAVHVARNTISNWERGQRQPDLDTLRLLGQVLHTDFLSGEELKNETPAEAETVINRTGSKQTGKRSVGRSLLRYWLSLCWALYCGLRWGIEKHLLISPPRGCPMKSGN